MITTEGLSTAVSVTITNPPRVLGSLPEGIKVPLVTFVNLNRDTLLKHWDGEIDSAETIALLRKI